MRHRRVQLVLAAAVAAFAAIVGPSAVAGGSLQSRLALMPLPKTELGPTAALLPLDNDSGVETNGQAVDNAASPTITAASFAKLGRITGYTLDYDDATGAALSVGHGLLQVQTTAELYRSAADAARGLAFWRNNEITASHLKISGVKIAVTPLKAPAIGTASFAFTNSEHVSGKPAVYGVDVYFTTGQIVGEVSVSAADRASSSALGSALAPKLASRIAGVIAGTISGSPVALPGKAKAGPPPGGPALAPLALTPSDLGGGKVTSQGYQLDPDLNPVSDYDRTIVGGSTYISFEEEVELFHSSTEASFGANILGRALSSKTFFQQIAGADLKQANITVTAVTPIHVSAGDEAFAARATFHASSGVNIYAGFIVVRVGSTIETIYAFGTQLTPASITSLAQLSGTRAKSKLK
jgi:hypothetical protein